MVEYLLFKDACNFRDMCWLSVPIPYRVSRLISCLNIPLSWKLKDGYFCLHNVIQVSFHNFFITRATTSSFGRNEKDSMEGVEREMKLIKGGGGAGGSGVDILLRMKAAGSVREECSSPQMPTWHSRGKCGSLFAISFFFFFFAFQKRTMANVKGGGGGVFPEGAKAHR